MIKILECTCEPILFGGQEMFIMNMLRNIHNDTFEIDVLTPYHCENEAYRRELESKKCKLICLETKFYPGGFRGGFFLSLKKYLKQNHYDIIHIHTGSVNAMTVAALSAKLAGVKRIIVHSHCTGVMSLSYRLSKLLGNLIIKRCATDYCACSVEAAEWKFPKSVINEKLVVVNNGINLDVFCFKSEVRKKYRSKIGLNDNDFCIGNVGRFSTQKNHKFLLEVFKNIKQKNTNSKLLLVGDGELRPEIEAQIELLGINDSVIMIGEVTNVADYMQAMDVFVFPSLWEGLGLVGVEAQATGLPVIASNEVPKTMDVTGTVKFLQLGKADEWADAVLQTRGNVRTSKTSEIRDHGYDVRQLGDVITELYLQND